MIKEFPGEALASRATTQTSHPQQQSSADAAGTVTVE